MSLDVDIRKRQIPGHSKWRGETKPIYRNILLFAGPLARPVRRVPSAKIAKKAKNQQRSRKKQAACLPVAAKSAMSTQSGRFTCPVCKVNIMNKVNFASHYKAHLGETTCLLCNYAFFSESLLQHHMATEHQEHTTCSNCQMVFGSLSILSEKSAVVAAKGGSGFECGVCGRRFSRKNNCMAHARTHRGETTCGVCNKRYGNRGNLKQHMALHEGRTTCHRCQKVFAHARALKDHMALHDGATQCLKCHHVASTAANLKLHAKIVHRAKR
ncbi:Hypothetical predicted protein [Cloeon dipterum]|uniref:C2H2-type domain-containing protein n=2 Tax=Cloeon dipterum TaxID=197152 RepID=A0A8S1CCR1_9INSE|nr:Hypothetical predicted protein [Cloeon dipterum]